MIGTTIKLIPLTTLDSSTFSDTWVAINPLGTPAECYLLRLTNNSDQDARISFDKVTEVEFLPSKDKLNIPEISYKETPNYVARVEKGTVVYIKAKKGNGLFALSGYTL